MAGAAGLATAIAAAAFFYSGGRQDAPPLSGSLENFIVAAEPVPVPPVALLAADGSRVTLDRFRGELVVLNFWATWCGPCVRELPSLQRLAARLPAGRARVVVVSQDRDGFERVTPFLVQRAIDIAASYVDERLGFSHAAGVSALPTTILLGPDGRELGRLIGAAEWDSPEAQALIGHYLAK
jgi:thiol-disulfide isomerase/thioredoxin